jgi:hypothetical protein
MKVVPIFDFEGTWWRLFQSLTLRVPDEGYSNLWPWGYLMNVVTETRCEHYWNTIVCFSSRHMIDKTMCEVLWRNISDFYVNLRVEVVRYMKKCIKKSYTSISIIVFATCFCNNILLQSLTLRVPDKGCFNLWLWGYLMKVATIFDFEGTWWRLFQSLTLRVPDEGCYNLWL